MTFIDLDHIRLSMSTMIDHLTLKHISTPFHLVPYMTSFLLVVPCASPLIRYSREHSVFSVAGPQYIAKWLAARVRTIIVNVQTEPMVWLGRWLPFSPVAAHACQHSYTSDQGYRIPHPRVRLAASLATLERTDQVHEMSVR